VRLPADADILMVTNAVMPDQLGGLQRYVRELAGALTARGRRVTVIAKRVSEDLQPDERTADGVRILRFDVPARRHPLYAALYPITSLRRVAAAVREHGGIVHVHYPAQGAAPALMARSYVHTFHAPVHKEILPERQDRYRLPRALNSAAVASARAWERIVASRAKETIVLTRYMREQLAALSPDAARRAHVIPGGLDGERFRPGPGIEHWLTSDADPLLFTARRLVPRTGVEHLVRAMSHVVRALPGARLAVAGDGPLRGEISELIAALGLSGLVVMLGRVSEEDLIRWYRSATLFVLPTQELEGFGISTIEALACGTPTLGTAVGGTPEILSDIDSRLLARSASPEDLAGAIGRACKPGVIDEVSALARAHVVPSMTWPRVVDRHLDVYERAARQQ
jgi:glycosyltransferase involved in cell wall biosynthesis